MAISMRTRTWWRTARLAAGAGVAALVLAASLGTAGASSHDSPVSPGGGGVNGVATSPFEDVTPPTFGDSPSLVPAQRWLDVALSHRTRRLDALARSVSGAKTLPGNVSAGLAKLVAVDSVGIGALAGDVSSATNVAALDQVAASMVDNYRVYAVVTPVVRTTLASYDQLAAVASLQALEPAIGAAMATDSKSSSADRAAALYRDLLTQLTDVTAADTAEAAAVLALGPASFPSSSAVLSTASSTLAASAARLSSARQDVQGIVALLAAPGLARVRARLGAHG